MQVREKQTELEIKSVPQTFPSKAQKEYLF
jgi:hypothetical protein